MLIVSYCTNHEKVLPNHIMRVKKTSLFLREKLERKQMGPQICVKTGKWDLSIASLRLKISAKKVWIQVLLWWKYFSRVW